MSQLALVTTLADSDSQVCKAGLRAVGNSALMRACGIAFKLARLDAKNVGNGIDGANDSIAARLKAEADAVFLNAAGKEAITDYSLMRSLHSIYVGVSDRLQDESWHKPMTLSEAIAFMSTSQDYDRTEGAAYVAALAKVLGEKPDALWARKQADDAKSAAKNAALAPQAEALLESLAVTGVHEDIILSELPVNVQFGLLAKSVDSAASQLDRDTSRAMKFINSKSSVLRNLAVSDVAAGKADLNAVEKLLLDFVSDHGDELV